MLEYNDQRTGAFSYMEDEVSNPRLHKPCLNIKRTVPSYRHFYDNGAEWLISGDDLVASTVAGIISSTFVQRSENFTVPIPFQKNNRFELLLLLGEFDEFLQFFTKEFWLSFNYGSYTWALQPILSDLDSLVASLADLIENRYERDIEDIVDNLWVGANGVELAGRLGFVDWSFAGHISFTGRLTPLFEIKGLLNRLKIILDELGVHPDIRTVWDLIPLSFVIDYFIPIGDLLESLHPRGWLETEFSAVGHYTLKGDFHSIARPSSPVDHLVNEGRALYKCYQRGPEVTAALSNLSTPLGDVEWKAPSRRQLLNVAYLNRERLNRPSKKIIRRNSIKWALRSLNRRL